MTLVQEQLKELLADWEHYLNTLGEAEIEHHNLKQYALALATSEKRVLLVSCINNVQRILDGSKE